MASVNVNPLYRENNSSYKIGHGIAVVPDVEDNEGWNMISGQGFPHYDEWKGGVIRPGIKAFVLSYKHIEHDFGKLSIEQTDELRTVLRRLVGVGPNKACLWVDSIYMAKEGLGMKDYSSKWVDYGLRPYGMLPVIRLLSCWNKKHESGKRSGWLWLERTLGKQNHGVNTLHGEELISGSRMRVKDALRMWIGVKDEFGFRKEDEEDVLAEIEGKPSRSAGFACPGGSSCIAHMLDPDKSPCGGRSKRCIELAKSVNGSKYERGNITYLILSVAGRIAESVLVVEKDHGGNSFLRRLNLSRDELCEYTGVLGSRELPFKNVRWLNLERFV